MVSREKVIDWLNEELDTKHFNEIDDSDFKAPLAKDGEYTRWERN